MLRAWLRMNSTPLAGLAGGAVGIGLSQLSAGEHSKLQVPSKEGFVHDISEKTLCEAKGQLEEHSAPLKRRP